MTNVISAEAQQVHRVPSGEFFPTLDGIRAIAILSVVVHHSLYFNQNTELGRILYAFVRPGWMGVPIFFVLSGFLISYTVFRSGARFKWSTYAARRCAKILPPFYLSIVIFTAIYLLSGNGTGRLFTAFANGTMLTPFLASQDQLSMYWTLFIEIHFYILLPMIYLLARRVTRYPAEATFLVFLIAPLLVRIFDPAISFQFPRALDNFCLGILFAIFYSRPGRDEFLGRFASPAAYLGLALIFLTFILYAYFELKYTLVKLPYPWTFDLWRYLPEAGTFLLLFSIFLPANHLLFRLLTLAPLVFCGLVSYEWFLFHQLREFSNSYFGAAKGNVEIYLFKILGMPLLTLAISAAIYHWISAPIILWTRKKISRKTA